MAETCDLLCLDLPEAEGIRAQQLEPAVTGRAVAAARALSDPTPERRGGAEPDR